MVKRYKLKQYSYLFAGAVLAIAFLTALFWPKATNKDNIIPNQETKKVTNTEVIVSDPPEKLVPESYQITVPFTVQAPFENWTVHEESCEEAAILMYHYFLSGTIFAGNIIPPATADTEFRKMKAWQVAHMGAEPDLTIQGLGEFAKSYYGYDFSVTKSATEEDIKRAISENHPVLVPVITHGLGNPHYGRYPTYHILVITGYDSTGVTTNDAGVKQGQNWHYTWGALWRAVDQQTAQMKQGRDILILNK